MLESSASGLALSVASDVDIVKKRGKTILIRLENYFGSKIHADQSMSVRISQHSALSTLSFVHKSHRHLSVGI